MRIRVEQKHIDKGVPSSARNCPIARAVNDHILLGVASVDERIITANHLLSSRRNDYGVPSKVTDFIKDFDNSLPVVPFKFTMSRRK